MQTLILVVWALGFVVGIVQGAFKQIANLIGIVAGLVLATMLYQRFGEFFAEKMSTSQSVGNTIAFVVISVVVPVALGLLASLLTKLFSAIHLGWANRLAGGIIGIVGYTLIMSFGFNIMDFVQSSAGYAPGKLEHRPDLYYMVKHSAQQFVPNVIIVSDSTEEASAIADGDTASIHHGLADEFSIPESLMD
jgi:membrane protein required for colicin V production